MIYILNFDKYTFGFYDFAQELINDNEHPTKHIALFNNNYIIYDANSGDILGIGYSKSGDWLNILRPTFELSSHDNIWPDFNVYSIPNLRIKDTVLDSMYKDSNMDMSLEDFSNAIFYLINNYNKQVDVLRKLYEVIPRLVQEKIGNISQAVLTQRVVNSEWNCEKNDMWYLSLSLDYIDNVVHTSTNLGDIYITNSKQIMLYPRARMIESKVPNKIKIITEIFNGQDTLNHNVSGIEYNITGIIQK